jgi:hypothetical protein
MTALFDKLGVRFEYPENWTLEDESVGTGHPSVTVVSPVGAFWSLTLHPASADLAALIRIVLDALRDEYRELDAEYVVQEIGGEQLPGYDISFYYLDMTSTAQVRGFQRDRGTYLVLCQAEDHDFAQVERVFLAMTTSLVRATGSTSDPRPS